MMLLNDTLFPTFGGVCCWPKLTFRLGSIGHALTIVSIGKLTFLCGFRILAVDSCVLSQCARLTVRNAYGKAAVCNSSCLIKIVVNNSSNGINISVNVGEIRIVMLTLMVYVYRFTLIYLACVH